MFTLQGELLKLAAFRFTGAFTESRSLRVTLRKIDSLIRSWHWFSRSNQATAVIFLSTPKDLKSALCPKFILEVYSSLAKDCSSSLIWCFSLCPFLIQPVRFFFCFKTGWTLFHFHWIPLRHLNDITFWNKWPCLLIFDLQPQNLNLLLNWYCLDPILTLSSPWSIWSGAKPSTSKKNSLAF